MAKKTFISTIGIFGKGLLATSGMYLAVKALLFKPQQSVNPCEKCRAADKDKKAGQTADMINTLASLYDTFLPLATQWISARGQQGQSDVARSAGDPVTLTPDTPEEEELLRALDAREVDWAQLLQAFQSLSPGMGPGGVVRTIDKGMKEAAEGKKGKKADASSGVALWQINGKSADFGVFNVDVSRKPTSRDLKGTHGAGSYIITPYKDGVLQLDQADVIVVK